MILDWSDKKNELKLNELKEPEDAKIPKDRKTNKKNPYTIKKKSEEQSTNSININLLIKEAFSNTETHKDDCNIESFKYINQKEENKHQNNPERSLSDAEQFNLIINKKRY